MNMGTHYRCEAFRRMLIDSSVAEELQDLLWNRPDEIYGHGQPLSDKTRARLTVSLDFSNKRYVIKTFIERSWRHALKGCFLPSRARRAWDDTQCILEAGVLTPPAMAWRERTLGGVNFFRSYFVYEYLAGQTLEAVIDGFIKQSSAEEALRQARPFIDQVNEIYRKLEAANVVLHDPSPSNFIVDHLGELWVIDLDKLEYPRSRSAYKRRSQVTYKNFWRDLSELGLLTSTEATRWAAKAWN